MLAIAVSGLAGYSKEHEITSEDRAEAGERDYSFAKGLAVAIFAGVMSSCFAYGLAAGKPIAEIARVQLMAHHRLDLWHNLPVLVVVLWGGFATNFVWSVFLIVKNHSREQFAGAPGINPMGTEKISADPISPESSSRLTPETLAKNYLLAALAGVIWYFQFSSTPWVRPRWASTTFPAGRCTWPASSSSRHYGEWPCTNGRGRAGAQGVLSLSGCFCLSAPR